MSRSCQPNGRRQIFDRGLGEGFCREAGWRALYATNVPGATPPKSPTPPTRAYDVGARGSGPFHGVRGESVTNLQTVELSPPTPRQSDLHRQHSPVGTANRGALNKLLRQLQLRPTLAGKLSRPRKRNSASVAGADKYLAPCPSSRFWMGRNTAQALTRIQIARNISSNTCSSSVGLPSASGSLSVRAAGRSRISAAAASARSGFWPAVGAAGR